MDSLRQVGIPIAVAAWPYPIGEIERVRTSCKMAISVYSIWILTMVELIEPDTFLGLLSKTRCAGDIDAMMALFHDDAAFGVIGVGEPVRGKSAIRTAVQALTDQYEFLEWRRLQSVVNGCDIAVRHHLKVKHRPSGKTAETETAEFIVLKDGKCSSFLQYADTALVFELARS